jgi:acetyl-CoA carboxylase biotin carboxyl carrier protein
MSEGEHLEAIRRLLRLADTYALAEMVVEENGLKVTIRGGDAAAPGANPGPSLAGAPLSPDAVADESRFHVVASPMTGVFYRAASPDVPPFVEIGDRIEEGQTIGLIEAMKVFSEIPADRAGRVVEILAASSQLISQGAPLMRLDPEG